LVKWLQAYVITGMDPKGEPWKRVYMKIIVTHIKQILTQRLEKKGVDRSKIPGLLRELANFDFLNPRVNLLYVNDRMHYLGWNDFKMDYHTLQLAIACFEAECFESS